MKQILKNLKKYIYNYMNEFIDFYRWGVYNRIILPVHGDRLKTIEELIILEKIIYSLFMILNM